MQQNEWLVLFVSASNKVTKASAAIVAVTRRFFGSFAIFFANVNESLDLIWSDIYIETSASTESRFVVEFVDGDNKTSTKHKRTVFFRSVSLYIGIWTE